MPTLVCISDTHGLHESLDIPHGDILIVAGDFTDSGTEREVHSFATWLDDLPFRHKVIVAGNHDFAMERSHRTMRELLRPAIYLRNQTVDICGLRIFGMPHQCGMDGFAFFSSEKKVAEKMSLAPMDTDILITHVPPFLVGDADIASHLGSRSIRAAVEKIKPKLHIFGHVHDKHGIYMLKGLHTIFCNVSIGHDQTFHPTVISIPCR